MRLDRELGPFGKYVVLRSLDGKAMSSVPGDDDECFVIKLRDITAEAALLGIIGKLEELIRFHQNSSYLVNHLSEYKESLRKMAARSGPHHPKCKIPD